MAAEKSHWKRIACRLFSGATVVCFFLPLIGVSCGPLDGLEVTGRQLLFGGEASVIIKGGPVMTGPGADEAPHTPDEKVVVKFDADWFARIVFCCAVVAFCLAWVPRRKALFVAAVTAVIGLVALGALVGAVGESLESLIASRSTVPLGVNGNVFGKMLTQMVPEGGLHVLFGCWLVALGFMVSAALSVVSYLEIKSVRVHVGRPNLPRLGSEPAP